MPQLVAQFFINETLFVFVIILLMVYVFSKYILPRIVRLAISRLRIIKRTV